MSRRLRPLSLEHLDNLPCECSDCVFWESADRLEPLCGAACDRELQRDWYGAVTSEWGECGRVAVEDSEILGFIKYAPPEYMPQARHFPGDGPRADCVLLTCMHIRDDARRHGLGTLMLRAALRDLTTRHVRHVQAYACAGSLDMSTQPVMGVEFLLRNGFRVANPHPHYPLLELDLRSLVTWTENIEAALQALRIPIAGPSRVPSPSIKAK